MNRIPFVAYFKINPTFASGRKFERIRSREKLAFKIYRDLLDEIGTIPQINLALPGGGVERSDDFGTNSVDQTSLSGQSFAGASTPQFGQFPSEVRIVGFYDGSTNPPYGEKTIIHAGEVVTGPASDTFGYYSETEPTSANQQEVRTLKNILESTITTTSAELIKLSYNGVLYGQEGLHFLPS